MKIYWEPSEIRQLFPTFKHREQKIYPQQHSQSKNEITCVLNMDGSGCYARRRLSYDEIWLLSSYDNVV